MVKHGKKSKSETIGKAGSDKAVVPARSRSKKPGSDAGQVGVLDEALTYVLRHAAASLRGAMADALRPLDLSAAQHSCLELLGRSPGLSSSDLALAGTTALSDPALPMVSLLDFLPCFAMSVVCHRGSIEARGRRK